MISRAQMSALVVALAAALGPGVGAQMYHVQASCPALIALPSTNAQRPVVFIRDASTDWRTLDFELEDGRIVIALDPAELAGGEAFLLIDPPADLNIYDVHAPALRIVEVDGRRLQIVGEPSLGASSRWPRRLAFAVEDAENALDPESVRVLLDGEEVTHRLRVTAPRRGRLAIGVNLPKPEYGNHEIQYSVADASPQANRVGGLIRFARHDMTNFVLAAQGTKLTADTHFDTYPLLDCLQDGKNNEPLPSLSNEVSWASAETDEPHWVEVEFAQPRTVEEVTIYWANYPHEFHTSSRFEVQIPGEDGWVSVYGSPTQGEKEGICTTVEFAPVEVSKLRVWQPGGAGSASRPNLMWVSEIEAR